jgi:hypothetical protein
VIYGKIQLDWLWGIGALFAAVLLVFDFVRWLGSKVANNEASALRRLFASTGSARLVGAIAAFNRIVSKSRWAKCLRKHPEVMKRGPFETSHTEDENIQRRLEFHLDNEINDKLRAGELTAWGRTNHGNPLRRIQSDEWDEIAIMFDKESLTKGSTNACAWLRDDRVPGGRIRYIEVQFLQTEIRKLFR